MSHTNQDSKTDPKKLLLLTIGALGVVYGDIGTSPLYAINEMFFGPAKLPMEIPSIIGAISLVVWALTIIISIKYVLLVLRADNDGEGGVFALAGLLGKKKLRNFAFIIPLLLFAAGLLYGDGIITPAISVISAVEGLRIVTPSFDPYIIPITIAILTGLFAIQKRGTTSIGKVFGPIIITWFLSIAAIGLSNIAIAPDIIAAINPLNAVQFLTTHSLHTVFLTLGSVMLVVTGGEAMFADMGHFGIKPIRLSWFSLAYPSLILIYLGQGAFLLSGQPALHENIFYSMVPSWALIPMIILATMSTIIASQALISGAFSLTSQAISLGLLPYLRTIQTHEDHQGQRYIPFINWMLYFGCVFLVITFGSSTKLASAYGLAVSGDMFITSLAMFGIAHHYWHWSKKKAAALFIPFIIIDFIFISANSLKIFQGGFVPLMVALFMLSIMLIWRWGRSKIKDAFEEYPAMSVKKLIAQKMRSARFMPRSIVILSPNLITSRNDRIPLLKQLFWDRYRILPKHLIFLTVVVENDPYIHANRYEIVKLYDDAKKGSITSVKLRFGFMEDQNVESELESLANHKSINIDEHPSDWLIHAVEERMILNPGVSRIQNIKFNIFQFLRRNSQSADEYFGLGNEVGLTLEVFPVKV
ncbi:MAG: KUP/HAK/KT family potassium transporter [Microgenomates group bacterium]